MGISMLTMKKRNFGGGGAGNITEPPLAPGLNTDKKQITFFSQSEWYCHLILNFHLKFFRVCNDTQNKKRAIKRAEEPTFKLTL